MNRVLSVMINEWLKEIGFIHKIKHVQNIPNRSVLEHKHNLEQNKI